MAGINIPEGLPPDLTLEQAIDVIIRLRRENVDLWEYARRADRLYGELQDENYHLREEVSQHRMRFNLVDEVFIPNPPQQDAPPPPPPAHQPPPPPPFAAPPPPPQQQPAPPPAPQIPPPAPPVPAPPVPPQAPVPPPVIPRPRRVPPVHPRINLFPIPRYPHLPRNNAEKERRRTHRRAIKNGKLRIDALFRLVVDECRGIAVPRALFDRHIKGLVGDTSPARLGLNLDRIPALGSPEELLLVSRFVVARDIAVANFRRRMLDRDVTVAMGTPLAP